MNAPRSRTLLAPLATLALVAALLQPAGASAASPAQIAPKPGAKLALGSQPTFKVRDKSAAARKYKVFITISTSKKRGRSGTLKRTEYGTFAEMRRKGSVYRYTAPDFSFDEWFMARRGTYYWQAYRVDCSAARSCRVHTKIRSFKVR